MISIFIGTLPAFAGDMPCYSKALSFKTVPHERPSTITLESRRVKAIEGNVFAYDLGKEIIIISAENFASQRFLKEVREGRCSAGVTVTLEPDRKSPFNTRFKTTFH